MYEFLSNIFFLKKVVLVLVGGWITIRYFSAYWYYLMRLVYTTKQGRVERWSNKRLNSILARIKFSIINESKVLIDLCIYLYYNKMMWMVSPKLPLNLFILLLKSKGVCSVRKTLGPRVCVQLGKTEVAWCNLMVNHSLSKYMKKSECL